MAFGVRGDPDRGVPKPLGHDRYRDAALEAVSGVAVPEGVQVDRWEPCGAGASGEQLGQPRRVDRPPELVDEEQLAVALPRRARRDALLKLAATVLAQRGDGNGIEAHGPRARLGLGAARYDLAADHDPCGRDDEGAALEVDC